MFTLWPFLCKGFTVVGLLVFSRGRGQLPQVEAWGSGIWRSK